MKKIQVYTFHTRMSESEYVKDKIHPFSGMFMVNSLFLVIICGYLTVNQRQLMH